MELRPSCINPSNYCVEELGLGEFTFIPVDLLRSSSILLLTHKSLDELVHAWCSSFNMHLMGSICASWVQYVPHGFNMCLMSSVCASWVQCVPHEFSMCLMGSICASWVQYVPHGFNMCLMTKQPQFHSSLMQVFTLIYWTNTVHAVVVGCYSWSVCI